EDAQAVAQALLDEPDADDRADRTPTIAVQLGNPRAELSAEGRAEIARIQAVLGAHGVRCVSVEAERETARLLRAHDVIMHYEFARSLAPVVERRADAVSAALRQAVVEGLAIGAGQYREMRALQAELRHGWRRLYDGADAVLTPSTPGPAPRGL